MICAYDAQGILLRLQLVRAFTTRAHGKSAGTPYMRTMSYLPTFARRVNIEEPHPHSPAPLTVLLNG